MGNLRGGGRVGQKMYVFVQIEMTAVSIRGPFNNYVVKMGGGMGQKMSKSCTRIC